MMREKYESLPLATLKELAKARGIKGVSTAKKSEVVELMLQEDEKEKKASREAVKEMSANTGDKEVHDIDKLDSGVVARGILEVLPDGYQHYIHFPYGILIHQTAKHLQHQRLLLPYRC